MPVVVEMAMSIDVEVQLATATLQMECVRFDVLLVIRVGVIAVHALPINVPRYAGRRTGHVGRAVHRHQISVLVIVGQARN